MPRKKNQSAAIRRAEVRAASLAAIDKQLDLGSGLTLLAYQDTITTTRTLQEYYNSLLTDADKVRERLLKQERVLDEFSTRMLAGVGAHFGRESDQYEKAGGKRPSARKSSRRSVEAMSAT
jgi:hypothetical protein